MHILQYLQILSTEIKVVALKGRDIEVTHSQNLCSTFNPSKVRTHIAVNTQPEQWASIYSAAPGEQLWVRCLARGIEGGKSVVHSLPPPTIPAGPRLELTTFGLQV